MSPVGHSIIGLSFAMLVLPRRWRFHNSAISAAIFVVLANLPDLPIPYWGHNRYDISHSIFVNVGLIVLVIFGLQSLPLKQKLLSHHQLILGSMAWLSHLLLDSFYNHGKGIAIFWPFSDGRLNLPIPWFRILDLSYSVWDFRNLSVFGIEFIAYMPILAIAILLRYLAIKRWQTTNRF
jgi:hypothetical protein